MKTVRKKSFLLFLAAVLAALCLALLLAACDKAELPSPSSPVPVYDIDLAYDGGSTAQLKEEILFTNNTGDTLTDISLHLYPNAFSEGASSPPYFAADRNKFFYNGESFGKIEISCVELNRKTSEYEICGTDNTILRIPYKPKAGETVTLSVTATLTLPACNARFGVTESTVNFTGFYPVLCHYENGTPRTEGYTAAGDPFFSDISSFYVTADVPEKFMAAASGEVTEHSVTDGKQRLEITAENVRDFALVLSEDFEVHTDSAALPSGDVKINYFCLSDKEAKDTLTLAADALRVFSDAFGEYPYSSFTVVQAPMGAGGMEFGTLVTVDPSVADRTEYERTVVHETAHQWWFGLVGSDQLNSPWMDEGLTEFSTAYYFRRTGDKTSYDELVSSAAAYYALYERMPSEIGFDSAMNRPLSSYLTNGEYVAVTYCKGLLLFDTLLTLAGENTMLRALAEYCSSNAYSVASQKDLSAAFERAGFAAAGIIDSFTSGTVVLS